MNSNVARKVFVAGNPQPYQFAAQENPLTDAQILSLLHQLNPNISEDSTLVWQPSSENGEEFLVAHVVPRAQDKGC